MVEISVCIYDVKMTLKFQLESGFLKGGCLMHYRKVGVPYAVKCKFKILYRIRFKKKKKKIDVILVQCPFKG